MKPDYYKTLKRAALYGMSIGDCMECNIHEECSQFDSKNGISLCELTLEDDVMVSLQKTFDHEDYLKEI